MLASILAVSVLFGTAGDARQAYEAMLLGPLCANTPAPFRICCKDLFNRQLLKEAIELEFG